MKGNRKIKFLVTRGSVTGSGYSNYNNNNWVLCRNQSKIEIGLHLTISVCRDGEIQYDARDEKADKGNVILLRWREILFSTAWRYSVTGGGGTGTLNNQHGGADLTYRRVPPPGSGTVSRSFLLWELLIWSLFCCVRIDLFFLYNKALHC